MYQRKFYNRLLAGWLNISEHTIDRITVNLSKADLIKTKGRGPHAMALSTKDASMILIAVMGASSTSKAVEAVNRLYYLKDKNDESFGEVIEGMFIDPSRINTLAYISMLQNGPLAWIANIPPDNEILQDSEGLLLNPLFREFSNINNEYPKGIQIEAKIGGGPFRMIINGYLLG